MDAIAKHFASARLLWAVLTSRHSLDADVRGAPTEPELPGPESRDRAHWEFTVGPPPRRGIDWAQRREAVKASGRAYVYVHDPRSAGELDEEDGREW